MRTSVLTGLFACGLLFSIQTASVSAESIDLSTSTPITEQKKSIIELLSMDKTNDKTSNVAEALLLPVEQSTATQESAVVAPPEIPKHIVSEGESLTDIAKKYSVDWKRIYDKNTEIADPDIITVGLQLTIPSKEEQLVAREVPLPPVVQEVPVIKKEVSSTQPKSVASAKKEEVASAPKPASASGNGYVAGYCTWYVKNKRPDLPNNLGNAATWVSRASSQGISTGSTPAAGAVGQRGNHVVYVESVNADGTVTISEMNHKGRYVTTTRTLPADYFRYIY